MTNNPRRVYQNAMQFLRSGDLRRAERLLRSLLERFPNDLDVLYSLAQIGFIAGRSDLIIEMMRRCIELDPYDGGAYHNLGDALRSKGHHDDAIAELNEAIRLMPNPAAAHNSLGLVFKDLGRMTESVSAFRTATLLDPSYLIAHSNLLMFSNYQVGISPEELFAEHRRWAEKYESPLRNSRIPHTNDPSPERKLRVGYVSPDLRQHSVAYFLLPLLEHHDRDQIHVTAYSNSVAADEITDRIQRSVDTWCPIAGASDDQVANRIRADQIDILVDLSGHTANHRLQVFALKPAPVQITWLGYPGSTGLDAMDYRCSDPLADPLGDARRLSSEQLLLLPRTTWCYDPLSGAPEIGPLPALTAPGITFCSFNNFGKISALTLDLWAEILRLTPGSRLVIKNVAMRSAAVAEQTRQSFAQRGIASNRLELLSPDQSLADHLGRYNDIDISLDTFPYHGTTTTCESLWMGVPAITLEGPNHASRPGRSLLHNVGLADLVAQTPDEYVDTAVKLAEDLPRLADIRAGLRRRMLESPLMDRRSFAAEMETAYRKAWRTWCDTARG